MNKLDKDEQNTFDGAFAVVDRERLIEEETRVVTPWYKHFINSIVSPKKMMTENYLQEPPKGNSIAAVGIILSTILIVWFNSMNLTTRQAAFDLLREKGIGEDMLSQQYIVTLVVGGILSFIGIAFAALLQTIILQMIKSGFKDRCKFKAVYTVIFMAFFISTFIGMLDTLAGLWIAVDYPVFNLSSFVSREAILKNDSLYKILSFFSMQRLVSVIYMIMGYSLVTGRTNKQSTIRILTLQIIIFVATIFLL